MTPFDLEMKIFTELKEKYKPEKGFHLVLNLSEYKRGVESLQKFEIDCEKYKHFINVVCNEENIESVILTSNIVNRITYRSKYLYAKFSYDLNEFVEIEDLSPRRKFLNRTLGQEMNLLCFELNNPKPVKPDC